MNPFRAFEPPATATSPLLKIDTYVHAWIESDDRWLLPPGIDWAAMCQRALPQAESRLDGRVWGDLHHLSPVRLGESHRLELGPIDGADGTVMATMHVAGLTTDAWLGSTSRYLWDLGNRSRSGWIVPFGVTEDEHSPHAFDQLPHYRTGQLISAFPAL